MLSLFWPVGGAVFLLAGTGVALWRQRPWPPGEQRPDRSRHLAALPPSGRDGDEDERRWSLIELLDLLPHPVAALGRHGNLLHANHAARAQLGDTLPALVRHPQLLDAIRRLSPDHAAEAEIALDVPVRRVLRASLRATGRDPSDARRRETENELILLSLTDRTEQEAVERMRVDFIANASHELRTPLASLIGFIETLQGPAADDAPAQARFLGIMASQAARMRRLIDNLLSLTRIQMHEHQRPDGRVDPETLLHRVADEHEPQIAALGTTLLIQIDEQLPQLVADPDQLAQVLHNLLDNALKHARPVGRPGQVRLAARAARQGIDPSGDGVVLSVADDGVGIAPQHVPRLTERFYRVEDSAPATDGSGLGLAIVKHIVGRHGGRLTIESRLGEGTRCSVWLPNVIPP